MSDQIDEKYESFLKLYRANESYISRYVLALCPNFSAAEDVMQETMLVMWRKYDQFVPGSNFLAWGMQIARLNVLNYQRKQKGGIVHFDSQTMDIITQHGHYQDKDQMAYLDALNGCINKLSDISKKVVNMRYFENMKVIDIASKLQKTHVSTYKMMSRIHHKLLKCVRGKLAKEGMS